MASAVTSGGKKKVTIAAENDEFWSATSSTEERQRFENSGSNLAKMKKILGQS
ncbi:unnamed protein product [Absidia cylindrospora]